MQIQSERHLLDRVVESFFDSGYRHVPVRNQVSESLLFTQSAIFVVHKKASSGYLFEATFFKEGYTHEPHGLPKSLGKALGATRYRSLWLLCTRCALLGDGTD